VITSSRVWPKHDSFNQCRVQIQYSYASCRLSVGHWRLRWHVLWSRHLWVAGWTIATHFLPALPMSIPVASTPVGTECGSSSGFRCSSSWPHHADPRDTSSASSSSASDLKDGGAGMQVSARRSATLLGWSECAGCVYGRLSSVSLCSHPGSPGALDTDVYWPAQLCCVCHQNAAFRSPELSLSSFKRQLQTHLSVPALDSAGCSCGCRVPSSGAAVTVQRDRRRLSRLNSTIVAFQNY